MLKYPFLLLLSLHLTLAVTLGETKRKTGVAEGGAAWGEAVHLPWYRGQDDFVEIFINDTQEGQESSIVGRAFVNLRDLEVERSHDLWLPIKASEKVLPPC